MTTKNKRILAVLIGLVSAAIAAWIAASTWRFVSLILMPSFDDAAKLEDVVRMKQLLARQPELANKRDELGRTPLFRAAAEGNKELVEVLLSYKADINARNNKGETPLNWMAITGNKNGAELLLSFKADVNMGNNRGFTPLHHSAIMNHREIVELLLAHHANINAKIGGDRGGTPLDVAVMVKRNEMAEFLRAHGGKSGKELGAAAAQMKQPGTAP